MLDRLQGPRPAEPPAVATTLSPRSNWTPEAYCAAVERAQAHIRAGDIYQVILSQRFATPVPGLDPLAIYRALRVVNPSPYMFLLDAGDGATLVGSSPERLVREEDGRIEMRPLAGTRPRGRDRDEDEAHARALLADPKERAEHVMLVDLTRNDVGRVARYGSVRVTELLTIERYSHVMHLVSHVEGVLAPGRHRGTCSRRCSRTGRSPGRRRCGRWRSSTSWSRSRGGPTRAASATSASTVAQHGDHDPHGPGETARPTSRRAPASSTTVPEREHEECVAKARGL